jgi:hypothetical protein
VARALQHVMVSPSTIGDIANRCAKRQEADGTNRNRL